MAVAIESRSKPGRFYEVDPEAGSCQCFGFWIRGMCWHLKEAEMVEKTEWSEKLRAPFPPEKVHQLPKGGRLLDFVGHAEVTDRLLEVDPEWYWEPMAFDAAGLPAMTHAQNGNPVGLWIRLTVKGVTRIGFGNVATGANDAEKQLISDAIRNAAMRFGVALDLWAKSDLHEAEHQQANPQTQSPSAQRVQTAVNGAARERLPEDDSVGTWERLQVLMREKGLLRGDIVDYVGGAWGKLGVDEWFQAAGTSAEAAVMAAVNGKRQKAGVN